MRLTVLRAVVALQTVARVRAAADVLVRLQSVAARPIFGRLLSKARRLITTEARLAAAMGTILTGDLKIQLRTEAKLVETEAKLAEVTKIIALNEKELKEADTTNILSLFLKSLAVHAFCSTDFMVEVHGGETFTWSPEALREKLNEKFHTARIVKVLENGKFQVEYDALSCGQQRAAHNLYANQFRIVSGSCAVHAEVQALRAERDRFRDEALAVRERLATMEASLSSGIIAAALAQKAKTA